MVLLILFAGIPLAPDEAQYWTWSKALDFGYYSKPPAIAWQIFLTTKIFGNTELGVRFGAVVLSFFLGLAVYKLAKNCRLSERASFWSAIAFAFSPLGVYLSFAATTDCGAILGLVLAISTIAKGISEKKIPNYILFGFWLYFGALYKWTAFIVYPFLFLSLFFYPILRSRTLIYGILISLLAFLPPLYWNWTHEFATFKHVFSTVYKPKSSSHGNFFSFLGAQIALFSPIFFVLYLLGIFKKGKKPALIFCTLFTSGALIYLILSIFKKMQPNWAAFFYPPGMILIGWYAIEKLKKGIYWLYAGTVLAIIISFGAFAVPYLNAPYKINPFRQNLGWNRLETGLQAAGYNPKTDFLFSDTYQMTSLLSFYGPNKKRAYFFNLQGNRKNQFSYWPPMSKEQGKTGYFVIGENVKGDALPWYETHYKEKLSSYCPNTQFIGAIPLFQTQGMAVKHALIFKCTSYNGQMPPDRDKY